MEELSLAGFLWCVVEVLRDNRAGRTFYEAMGMQTEDKVRWRPTRTHRDRPKRYSRPHDAVAVVRYEAPLVAIDLALP